MQYILLETSPTSFVIAKQHIASNTKYHQLATCRSRIQAETLVSLLNRGDQTLGMVEQFHEAFGISQPKKVTLPNHKNKDIKQWLKETGQTLVDTSKLIKAACAKLGQDGENNTLLIRMQLMVEELGEVLVAMSQGDAAQTLHELADLRYVVDGTVLSLGMGEIFLPAIQEIHRANMSKLDEQGKPVIGPSGRVEKSKLFKKADVSFLLKDAA